MNYTTGMSVCLSVCLMVFPVAVWRFMLSRELPSLACVFAFSYGLFCSYGADLRARVTSTPTTAKMPTAASIAQKNTMNDTTKSCYNTNKNSVDNTCTRTTKRNPQQNNTALKAPAASPGTNYRRGWKKRGDFYTRCYGGSTASVTRSNSVINR